jgi:Uncharacterised nucleotidyltransferase
LNVPNASRFDGDLATLLTVGAGRWDDLRVTPAEFIDACATWDVTGLVHERLDACQPVDWPLTVRETLASRARMHAARELVHRKETANVLKALVAHQIHPILFKGTALAYDVYGAPYLRPRSDTDLLIPRSHIEATRHVLEVLGYSSTVYCDGELLFCQFEFQKKDEFGIDHALDVHWKISTQSVFADLLTYEELDAQARSVPALGPHARCAGPLHALLLACLHPVMHHRNTHRLIWIYDVHLLASRLSEAELDQFGELATSKRVLAICAHVLATARARFGTFLPEPLTRRLNDAPDDEPSAVYLQQDRRWPHELSSNLRGLTRWRDRVRLLREVLLPAPAYMLRTYGLAPRTLGTLVLPVLYLHRGLRGGVNVLTGRK